MKAKRVIDAICTALEARYGSPDLGNKPDPLDELVYIVLSTRSQAASFQRRFQEVKAGFQTWESILGPGGQDRLEEILDPAG